MKFNLSISRDSRDRVGIRVKCKSSKIAFLELDLSLEEYASIITGLSEVEVEGNVRNLNNVGKVKIREERTSTMSSSEYNYNKENAQKYLLENCQEEGWQINTYLGSQQSIVKTGDVVVLNYHVEKWLEEEENEINI